MTLQRQILFWSAALAVFVALLWLLQDVLLPFVAAMVLGYLLDPLVRRLHRLGLPRPLAAIVIVLVFIAVLAAAILLIAPILGTQIVAFVEKLPGYVDRLRELAMQSSDTWLGKLVGERLPDAQKSLGGLASQVAGWAVAVLASLWSGGKALVSLISLVIITPIVTFYLLIDWDKMLAAVDSWIPRPHRDTVRRLAREMNAAISGFVRGQALVCLILGIFYCIALSLLGLNFALLIGVVAAILGFAPYVGAITGLLLATGIAAAQFWPDWKMVAAAAGIFVFGQMMEGNVLQPNLVGKNIGLHPVWLMFALLAFGYLFGFVGLLVAVPVAAAIGVLIRFILRQYLASSYYTGGLG